MTSGSTYFSSLDGIIIIIIIIIILFVTHFIFTQNPKVLQIKTIRNVK